MAIPKSLKDIAAGYGCNTITFITTTTLGDIYSLSATDDNGMPMPMGLPMLFAVNESAVNELPEDQAFEILSTLKDE